MQQKTIRLLLPGLLNLPTETKQTEQTAWPPDPHPQIHDHHIRKTTEIDCLTLNPDAPLISPKAASSAPTLRDESSQGQTVINASLDRRGTLPRERRAGRETPSESRTRNASRPLMLRKRRLAVAVPTDCDTARGAPLTRHKM